jgi:hypothetical protein
MADEMMKRVACALCREAGIDPDRDYSGRTGWKMYVKMAQAAIGAMHEPTDEMMAAAGDALAEPRMHVGHRGSDAVAGAVGAYRAMIDAALSEP